MARIDPKFMLRMPEALKERVQIEAAANKRSLNAEIIDRLEKSFSEETKIEAEVSIRVDQVLHHLTKKLEEMSAKAFEEAAALSAPHERSSKND